MRNRPHPRAFLPGGLALSLLLSSGCWGGEYAIEFRVTIDDGVDIPLGARVVAVIDEEPESPALRLNQTESEPADPDVREYTLLGEVCCAPEPVLSFRAFLDLDDDGQRDDDEPAGEDPESPHTLGRRAESRAVEVVISAPGG